MVNIFKHGVRCSEWFAFVINGRSLVGPILPVSKYQSSIIVLYFLGKIPVKDRGDIVENFNRKTRGPQVMLLSLAAGGVGLNLVGANHLFLLDMHWNPQLEAQACDRIYRVGQTKDVVIHRFLCENTVETRIQDLQRKKLELAEGVLTGAKRSNANKLTFDDLKMLFNVGWKLLCYEKITLTACL